LAFLGFPSFRCNSAVNIFDVIWRELCFSDAVTCLDVLVSKSIRISYSTGVNGSENWIRNTVSFRTNSDQFI